MIGISKKIPWVFIDAEYNQSSQFCIASGKLEDQLVTLVWIYAPDDQQFGKFICSRLYEKSSRNVILMGDFDAVIDTKLDHSKLTKNPGLPLSYLMCMTNLNLTDVWRDKYKDETTPSTLTGMIPIQKLITYGPLSLLMI